MYHDRISFDLNSFITSPFARFKGESGGGTPPQPTASIADTPTKEYARTELYPLVTQGLAGKGYGTPGSQELREKSLYTGLDKTFATATSDLKSQSARTIDPRDTRVKDFVSDQLGRSYFSKKNEIREGLKAERIADVDLSMGIASEYLAGEKRMSINTAQMYNQALQQDYARQSQIGTFGTNVAAGVGSGMVDYYYAQKMGA